MRFLVNYVFKYDPRPGTKADDLPDDVDDADKKARHRRLLDVAERVQRKRFEAYRGREVDVFVESVSERDPRVLLGRTFHGLPISFPGGEELVGTSVRVTVDETTAYGMGGRRAEPAAAGSGS